MVVLPEADKSEDGDFDVDAALAAFLANAAQLTLELPHMTTGQRRHARKLVESHPELKCESYGFGEERQLHIFKKGFGESTNNQNSGPAVNVKNTFIDDWIAPEDAPEPVVFRSMPLQGSKSPLQDAIEGESKVDVSSISDASSQAGAGQQPSAEVATLATVAAAAGNGRALPRWPKELQPEVRNTFIHIEGDSLDERMVQTMPHGMFRQNVSHEAAAADAETIIGFAPAEGTSTCGGSSPPPPPLQPAPAGLAASVDMPAPPASTAGDPLLAPGTQILVEGLVRAPAFNGLNGVVQFYEEETGRYSVLLASPCVPTGVQWAKIKGENLRLAAPPPYCAMGAEVMQEPVLAAETPLVPGLVATPLRLTALV